MIPELENSERIIISRNSGKDSYKRFDIIITKDPDNKSVRIIKRIIGMPNENISIKNGKVYINRKILFQPFLKNSEDVIFKSVNMKEITIPADSYFLLGDNRNLSRDSRQFGTVHSKMILGKVFFRYWPISKLGAIK